MSATGARREYRRDPRLAVDACTTGSDEATFGGCRIEEDGCSLQNINSAREVCRTKHHTSAAVPALTNRRPLVDLRLPYGEKPVPCSTARAKPCAEQVPGVKVCCARLVNYSSMKPINTEGNFSDQATAGNPQLTLAFPYVPAQSTTARHGQY